MRADHFLAVIIDYARTKDTQRFALYDYDQDQPVSTRVYKGTEYEELQEIADRFNNVMIVRFET